MTERRGKVLACGLLLSAAASHLVVCRWGAPDKDRAVTTLVRIPNVARYILDRGPRDIHVCVDDRIGRVVGWGAGVAMPALLIGFAGYIRFSRRELKQLMGVGAFVLAGLGIVVVLIFAAGYW